MQSQGAGQPVEKGGESRSQETLEMRKHHMSQTPLVLNLPYSWGTDGEVCTSKLSGNNLGKRETMGLYTNQSCQF